jgi:hypothetical protein
MTTDRPELAALSSVAALVGEVDGAVVRLVAQARKAGATWEDIGTALRITRQGAHSRYAHLSGVDMRPETASPLEAEDVPAP